PAWLFSFNSPGQLPFMEERPTPDLEIVLLMVTCMGLLVGAWGILWTRASHTKDRILVGRCLFVGTLLVLGGSSLVAAFNQADGLAPLGLSAGLLVSLMLVEAPRSENRARSFASLSDEA